MKRLGNTRIGIIKSDDVSYSYVFIAGQCWLALQANNVMEQLNMSKNLSLFFIGVALSATIGLAHSLSYQDALADQQTYCTNVEHGIWPDYKKIYKKVCK